MTFFCLNKLMGHQRERGESRQSARGALIESLKNPSGKVGGLIVVTSH